MRILFSIVCVLLLIQAITAFQYTSEAQSDEITNLPGAPTNLKFRQFAGYLNVDPVNQRNLFYWFVESTNSPASDPLVWWSNGGPGCSGLLGFLTEHGPFRANKDGTTLFQNPYAWNQLANMLYIEAPAGVGFSYSMNSNDYTVGDARTADDNYKAIQSFLLKFPQYAKNDFFISSESYGGHYIPTLAESIVTYNNAGVNPKLNFKGFFVGNPYTDPNENTYGQFETLCGHSVVSKPTCDAFQQHCLPAPGDAECALIQGEAQSESGNLDAYGLDYPVCLASRQKNRWMMNFLQKSKRTIPIRAAGDMNFPDDASFPYDACAENEETNYLNIPAVQAAIHVNPNLGYNWTSCSNIINYNQSDSNVPMEPIYQSLLQTNPDLRMWIFSGDDDTVCATLGTQQWLYALNLPVVSPWTPWTTKAGQVGGYQVIFKGITFTTVHSAGHMVGDYQPEKNLELFAAFLKGSF